MAEQNNNGATDAMEMGAQAAHVVNSAVKTGKAIAGAAKGAAAGGPYGAVAVALWENRRVVVKIVLAVLALFLLPILFLAMLPQIIFGDLNANPDIPVMNNDAAIMENVRQCEAAVSDIIQQSHDKIAAEIYSKIDKLDENEVGIMQDDYAAGISFNGLKLLSEYSASKKYDELDCKDLSQRISDHKGELFSFTTEKTSSVNAEGVEITTYRYIVSFVGDAYFGKHVFKLNQEQRELADDYAENLSVYLYGVGYQGSVSGGGNAQVSQEVRQYDALINKYVALYGISDFGDVIRAMMQAESGGKGGDVMQSSECPLNTRYPNKPNSITDPEYSIDVGVHYFANCLKEAGCSTPQDRDKLNLALQGYNFGNGYIGWAVKNYGGYSESNALEFSNMMKEKHGWSVYGNPRYVAAVLKYYIPSTGAEGWGSPFVGKDWKSVVTSEFGYRNDPITGKPDGHSGIDIGYPTGTPINAVKAGVVTKAVMQDSGYGYHIVIDHGNGEETLYGHCSKLLVQEGQTVSQGQVIALVGATGRVTGPHLHLNVTIGGELRNPRNYIR